MWFLWLFALVIPLGVLQAIVTGEISMGRHTMSILTFEEQPIGFIVSICAFCLMELLLIAALIRIRREDRAAGAERRRGRKR